MYDVGLEYDGEGGGHAPAAGAKGVNDFKKAATQIIDTITALLSG
jgi:nanoRNase/pAp phosphatase (c-di-AMP/oligoRNAs hydrolase)